MLKITR